MLNTTKSATLFFVFNFCLAANSWAEVPLEQQRMIVTASRWQQDSWNSLASNSVINAAQIEASQARDLIELLRLQAGLDIVRTGGPGAQTSVFLRGTNSNHTLVLVDGVRVASTNTGAFSWETLPLNQIQRIEIVRGPRASLYGSDAIGGVIQIFTRQNTETDLRFSYGSHNSKAVSAGVGSQNDQHRLAIHAGYRDSSGFSAQNTTGFSFHPDDDGYQNTNAGLNGSLQIGAGQLAYSALFSNADIEFDQGISDSKNRVGALAYQSDTDTQWNYSLHAGYSSSDLFTDGGFFTSDFHSRRWDLGWRNHWQPNASTQIQFGLDYYDENGRDQGNYNVTRDNWGAYLHLDQQTGQHHFELSARFDENSQFGSETTGQLAWGYQLSPRVQLIASYGTAFRAPNLNEQFSPGFGGFFAGNPDLGPESSNSAELTVRWQPKTGHRFSASVYQTDIDDLIAFSGMNAQAVNINQARTQGAELEYAYLGRQWQIDGNLTLQDAEDRNTGSALLRRPDEKLSVRVQRRLVNNARLGVEVYYSAQRDDLAFVDFNQLTVALNRYWLVNLRGDWPLSQSWSLGLRLENALNEAYNPAYGFNAAGRSGWVHLSWRP